MKKDRKTALLAALLVAAGLVMPRIAAGQDDAENQAVARVAFLEGTASYNRGDDPDDWQPAQPNFPLTTGDRFWTAGGARAELQTIAGNVFIAPETDLSVLNLTYDVSQLSVGEGTASFRIHRLAGDDSFEVATPNASVTFLTPGQFRIDVDNAGNTRVSVLRGAAAVAAAGGQVRLQAGDAIHVEGIDEPHYDVIDVPGPDSWDRWVEARARSYREVRAGVTYAGVVGIDDLDHYGRWEEIPGYGRCWTPSSVAVDWVPYRAGAWVWRDPWGWTWVSTEPWGWAPYHYGRWVVWSSHWFWVPDSPRVVARWAPAYVGFVGGGPGWSVSAGFGVGYVGWFPLAPREPFQPWWPHRVTNVNVNVTNVTYVNRTYVTVVNQQTFVSGAPVARNVVRDPQVVRKVETAPVAHGVIPVAPSRASLHVAPKSAASPGAAPRPPAPVLHRSVVSKMPPPPAPKPFLAAPVKESRPQGAVTARPPSRTEAESSHVVRPTPVPERKAAPPPWQTEVRPAPTPETKAVPPARRADVHAVPTPVTKAIPPERKVEVKAAAPTPPPPTRVRPAQAEKVQLQPRGEVPQRRKVEPLKESPSKKKESAAPAQKTPEKKPEKKPEGRPEH